ncbi:DNA mismatch endonuclease Vsr [uncultured Bradyrhizobium sp.]|uniref:very short patch repair endonuclease n=1 Tax=Bradyrhizobium sp. TaxID=376 RepID=UPI002623CB8D|nr:DNA mismatch endonuclease Vsr [uncultured Bradyrhizobium sp.]
MVDVVDRITRSRMMAGIRGKNTKPELVLRHALHRLGLRYRLHVSTLPGRPDIVMPKYRAIVQVQGCFWHRHEGCSFATIPASNIKFWDSKFAETIRRDHRNLEALRRLGWRVAVVWECAINKEGGDAVATRVAMWLSSKRATAEIPAWRTATAVRTRS